jgi:hypothetical protein
MRSINILLGIVLVLLLAGSDANACSCEGRRPVCEAYGAADAVFVGTVTGVAENKSNNQAALDVAFLGYKFSVEQAYSGISGTQVEVFTTLPFGACGFPFQVGERYLVYARRDKGKLTTSICTRTKSFERASEDLAFLGTLTSVASGVTLYGELHRDVVQGDFKATDALITVESGKQPREVRPDAAGNFRVDGLSPGKIILTLKLPERFTTSPNELDVTVSDRGCARVDWWVNDNGRISGRVISTDGELVQGIQVTLEDPSDRERGPINYESTDENGEFLFAAVPAGIYFLSVNRSRHPDPGKPTNAYAPTFYPGVIDETQARVITLGPGEKLGDLEVKVTKRPPSILEGTVVWSDGTPVNTAVLYVKDLTQADSVVHGIPADEQGRFKIYGYVGQKLIIEAKSDRPTLPILDRSDSIQAAAPVTIALERLTQPLRIVIPRRRQR